MRFKGCKQPFNPRAVAPATSVAVLTTTMAAQLSSSQRQRVCGANSCCISRHRSKARLQQPTTTREDRRSTRQWLKVLSQRAIRKKQISRSSRRTNRAVITRISKHQRLLRNHLATSCSISMERRRTAPMTQPLSDRKATRPPARRKSLSSTFSS